MSRRISVYGLIGLPLLYASGYFLPALEPTGAYLLPSRNLFQLVVLPSLVAAAVGIVAVYTIATAARKWCSARVATVGAVVALSVLTLMGLKGITQAAGIDWQERVFRGHDIVATLRLIRVAGLLGVVVFIWVIRGALPKLTRLLGSLGFAFAALAAIRLLLVWHGTQAVPALSAAAGASAKQSVQASSILVGQGRGARPDAAIVAARSRRVVWVIFDETDYNRVYGANNALRLQLSNFTKLAHAAVFATDANSPASGTLFSIPALLTGLPIGGSGIRIGESGGLSLDRLDGKSIPLGEATSIFGALSADGRSASVLGFLHPYCKLFRLQRCDGFTYDEVGAVDSGLWANVSGLLARKLRHGDHLESVTRQSLHLLPEYLARDDSLTYIHLNVPHPPADYADQALHLPASADPVIEYEHNLKLTDGILGEIMQDLQEQASRHDLLLVVSSDHWLRNRWYQASVPDVSLRVPLIVWKVGDTEGIVVSQPLSTVHTAAMILEYLDGNLSTQSDFAQWWARQPVYPSFIAPNT